MLFDWFTFIMQFFNFLLLVWLMRRFLYKPILKAIDERENYITSQLQDAEEDKAKANQELERLKELKKNLEDQQQELLEKAVEEADSTHRKLLEEARKDADNLRAKLHDSLVSEQKNLSSEFIQRTQEEIFSISRRILADLASVSLETQMTHIFLERIIKMDQEAKETLHKAILNANSKVIVRSCFDLESQLQSLIQTTIEDQISVKVDIKFETAPYLIGGIALIAEGYMVVWSISDYLASLEANVAGFLKDFPAKTVK